MEKEVKRMHKARSPIFFISGQRLQQLLNETGMADRMDRVEVEQAVRSDGEEEVKRMHKARSPIFFISQRYNNC